MSIASRIQKETLKWTPDDLRILNEYAMRALPGLATIMATMDTPVAAENVAIRAFQIAEAMVIEYENQKKRSIKIAATNPGV